MSGKLHPPSRRSAAIVTEETEADRRRVRRIAEILDKILHTQDSIETSTPDHPEHP